MNKMLSKMIADLETGIRNAEANIGWKVQGKKDRPDDAKYARFADKEIAKCEAYLIEAREVLAKLK